MTMFESIPRQEGNGADYDFASQENTSSMFRSVLPSASMLEMKGDLSQQQLVHGIRNLPLGMRDVPSDSAMIELDCAGSMQWMQTRSAIDEKASESGYAPATAVLPTASAKAKDLELAGEVALFREIMSDWGLNDQQASAILGYKEPRFATDLYRGLTSIRQRDAEERLQLIITIAVDLEALYREYDVIRKWLRKPHELLNQAVPLAMATEGTSLDLLKLSEYVEYLSGR